jgi:DNA-binding PucR family transcriptional regulator
MVKTFLSVVFSLFLVLSVGAQAPVGTSTATSTLRQQARERLLERLQQVKDQRKQQIVLRLDERFGKLNNTLTTHFNDVLGKLEKVLERIGTRADKAQSRGLNVSAVRTAIADAQKAIADAKTAVSAQTAKTYPITITTENKLREDVKKVRQSLFNDLRAARAAVVAARDAVHKAAVTLAQIPRVDEIGGTTTAPAATSTSEEQQRRKIGGDKDKHGCLIAAGYTWCESKQKCLRTWEEGCNATP